MPIARNERATSPDFTPEERRESSAPPKQTTMLLRDQRLREAVEGKAEDLLTQEALSQSDPAQGVSMLTVQLNTLDTATAASAVYSVLGSLYLRVEPPDPLKAVESLREAQRLAEDPQVAQEALLAEVRILQKQSGWEEAGPRLRESYKETPEVSIQGLQLAVLLGKFLEESGDVSGAEETYTRAAERVYTARDTLGEEADAIYRQVCLNLARLYRTSGKNDEAESLLRTMRTRLEQNAAPAP